jgi:hypothetical protein
MLVRDGQSFWPDYAFLIALEMVFARPRRAVNGRSARVKRVVTVFVTHPVEERKQSDQ